jgi:hypothetical protein
LEGALPYFKQVVIDFPGSATMHNNLAMTYLALNENLLAMRVSRTQIYVLLLLSTEIGKSTKR